MSKEIWVRPTGRLDEVAGSALEAGAQGVLVDAADAEAVQGVGKVTIATVDGATIDLDGRSARVVQIASPEDQDSARKLLGEVDALVIETEDWTIIPLENLIAWANGSPTRLLARVRTEAEAEIALTTLETGVDGIVLETDEPATVKAVANQLDQEGSARVDLEIAEVIAIEEAGMGDRVCVDTTSLLEPTEGLLVGSASAFLALVASEASEAGYVASRPFRVNAGAVHAYALAPDGQTRYLSEVQAGVRLLAVETDGTTRTVVTGRAKVERRPMLLVRLRTGDTEGSIVVQNAETIRLVGPDGLKSVADLSEGDEVLVHLAHATGRHFGAAVEETVREV